MIDSKAELYFQIASYAYAANTPINAIDPDGKLVIFINGNHYGNGGSRRYWQAGWERRTADSRFDESKWVATRDFAGAVMKQLGDYNAMYVDGAGNKMKGYHPLSTLLSPGLSGISASDRRLAGYADGKSSAGAIIESLQRTGGVITESIKVITHSMGGAYGKGYVQAILDYARENNIEGVKVDFEADFAPFQPNKQKAVKGVPTFQFSHSEDMVAGNDDIPGAIKMNTISDRQQGHSIFGFMEQIRNLPAGKYKIVGGEIVPDN